MAKKANLIRMIMMMVLPQMMSLLTRRRAASSPSVVILFLLLLLHPSPPKLVVVNAQVRTITLRAGLIANPPEDVFQMDILKEIQKFAAVDEGILLQVDVETLPDDLNYNDAFDLISNDCSEKMIAAQRQRQQQPRQQLSPPYDNEDAETITTTNATITTPDDDDDICSRYDFLIGSYFANKERYLRADLTPSWLQAAITANRYEGERPSTALYHPPSYYTFEEADKHGGTICVFEGTYYARVIQDRYKNANYYKCHDYEECIEALTLGKCAMYAGNDTILKYQATKNPALIQTKDEIHKNFMIWPMSLRQMSLEVRLLMKGWIYQAVATTAVERLYQSHFALKTCPLGFAGPTCSQPCNPKHGSSNVFGKCVCDSTKWEGDDCSLEVLENFNLIPTWQQSLAYVMVTINFVTVLGCACWLYRNRNLPRINIAQPFFLGMILLGCVVSTSTILALMQQSHPYDDDASVISDSSESYNKDDNHHHHQDLDPREDFEYDDNIHCMAAPWLYSIGFCITFGTLFAKIRRVHQIFRSSCEMKRVTVTIQSTLTDIALVLGVDIIILMIWNIVDPLRWERTIVVRDKYDEPLESVGMCTSEHWNIFIGMIGSFHFLLLCIGCYMCYVTRNVPKRFSGGSSAAMAMFSNFQILLVGVPFMFVANNTTHGRFFLQSAIVWLNDLVVIMITFGSLMVAKHYDFDQASMKTLVKKSLGEYIENESNENKRISSCSMTGADDSSRRQQEQQRYSNNINKNNNNLTPALLPTPKYDSNDERHRWTTNHNNKNTTFDHDTISSSKKTRTQSSSSTTKVSFQGLSSEGTTTSTCIADDETENPVATGAVISPPDHEVDDYSKLVEEKVPEDKYDGGGDDDDDDRNKIATADPTVTSYDGKDDPLYFEENEEDDAEDPPPLDLSICEGEDLEDPLPTNDDQRTTMLPEHDKGNEQTSYASSESKNAGCIFAADLEDPSLQNQSTKSVQSEENKPEHENDNLPHGAPDWERRQDGKFNV